MSSFLMWLKIFNKTGLLGFIIIALQHLFIVAGETEPIYRWIQSIEDGREVIYNGSDLQNIYALKFAAYQKIKPEVIVIGNSRANSFRKNMFHPYSFYNLSRTFVGFNNALGFLEEIEPYHKPKYIFLIIEPFQFKRNFELTQRKFDSSLSILPKSRLESLITFGLEFNHKRYSELKDDNKYLGVKAKKIKRGFRSIDGSHSEGQVRHRTVENNIKRLGRLKKKDLESLSSRELFFNFNQPLSNTTYDYAQLLIKQANELDITIIGVTPPYSQDIQNTLDSDPITFQLWHEFQTETNNQKLSDIFNGLYFNFSRFSSHDGQDYEMLDLIHPSEKIIGKMLLTMLQNKTLRNAFNKIDENKIKTKIKNNPLPLYDIFSESNYKAK